MCDLLEFSNDDFQGLTSLKYLKLSRLPKVKQLPKGLEDSAATLNHLVLDKCHNMTLTEHVIPNLESLEVLEIHACEMITSLPQGMRRLHKLSRLEFSDPFLTSKDCNLLLERYQLTGENWHKIAHVPHIYINDMKIESTTSTVSRPIVTPNLKIFTYNNLKHATGDFRPDSVVGEGSFGQVFKGWVDPNNYEPSIPGVGMLVAVKKSNSNSLSGLEEWQAEVKILGSFSHLNLVKLLGYCLEEGELLLVYEYMDKGSLESLLFKENVERLSWKTRIKIAIGAARGLAFLHTTEKQVIYGDFKASSIFLDEDFNAKLSDYGLAKLKNGHSHVTKSKNDYAAPEYITTGQLSVKSDVYGFGVVLLEILIGLRVLDSNRPEGEKNLVAMWSRKKKQIWEIMDPRLGRLGVHYPAEGALYAWKIVFQCLDSDPQTRPSMEEILAILAQIGSYDYLYTDNDY